MRELSDDQLMRYSRHIMLPSMDIDGQEALWNASVLIIGLGGLGCAASQYLAASGIGNITLIDDDKVDKTNLQRQILHTEQSIGMSKVISAKSSLQSINSEIDIVTFDRRLNEHQLHSLIRTQDVVIDCCDNLVTRNQLNQLCWRNKVPLVSGSAIRMEGQVSTFTMEKDIPCYACLSQFFGEQQLTCSESGILSPVVGIVGAIQATEVIKIVSKMGELLTSKLLLIDAMQMSFNTFSLSQNPTCPVCA